MDELTWFSDAPAYKVHAGMNLATLFGLLGGLLVLAFAANRLFRWTRIPDVVVLMATGILIGPVLRWANADQFKDVTHAFGTLALILILFEGGLDLNIRETVSHFPGGLLFGVLTYGFTTVLVGFVASASLGMSRTDGLLAGAVVGCTSSTIVLPVLQQWKTDKVVKIILLLESTVGDILGVLTVGFLLRYRQPGSSVVGDFLTGFLSQIAISLAASFLIDWRGRDCCRFSQEQQFWRGSDVLDGIADLRWNRSAWEGSGLLLRYWASGWRSPTFRERRQPVTRGLPHYFTRRGTPREDSELPLRTLVSWFELVFFVLIGVVVQLSRAFVRSGRS